MSNQDKGRYYRALKASGVGFEKHYREYTAEELKGHYDRLVGEGHQLAPLDGGEPEAPEPEQPVDPEAAAYFGYAPPVSEPDPRSLAARGMPSSPTAPVVPKEPPQRAGAPLNTQGDEPIRFEPETNKTWFQEEVLKPAYPKPRGRRVLTYLETGVETKTVSDGRATETFEVAGSGAPVQQQIKVTLPSYQVGIYSHPSYPFKVVCYNGNEGFALFDVQNYYGGKDLVAPECKKKYVENVLCYDIPSVVRAIETEYRRMQLAGRPEL